MSRMVLESSTVSIFRFMSEAPGVEFGQKAEVGIGVAKGGRGVHDREPAAVHVERAGGCKKKLDSLGAEAFDGRGIQGQKGIFGDEGFDAPIEVANGRSVENGWQIMGNLAVFGLRQFGISTIYGR
jgi:hypothetical protein